MFPSKSHWAARQGGMAVIEMALVLPFFLMLIFGSLSYGVALYNQAVITNASREAARSGVTYRVPAASDSEIVQTALRYCQDNLITFGHGTDPQVAVSYSSGRHPGAPLTVSISYAFKGVMTGGFVSPDTLRARATMIFE